MTPDEREEVVRELVELRKGYIPNGSVGRTLARALAAIQREPAPCLHRELLEECRDVLYGDPNHPPPSNFRPRLEAALAAPCQPAQDDEWEEIDSTPLECADAVRLPEHRLIATRDVQDGDRIVVYRKRCAR